MQYSLSCKNSQVQISILEPPVHLVVFCLILLHPLGKLCMVVIDQLTTILHVQAIYESTVNIRLRVFSTRFFSDHSFKMPIKLILYKKMCIVGIYSPLISLNSNLNYKEVQNSIVKSRHLSLEKYFLYKSRLSS